MTKIYCKECGGLHELGVPLMSLPNPLAYLNTCPVQIREKPKGYNTRLKEAFLNANKETRNSSEHTS